MVPGYIKKKNDGRGTHREAACLEVSSGQKHLIGIIREGALACVGSGWDVGGDKEEEALLDQLGALLYVLVNEQSKLWNFIWPPLLIPSVLGPPLCTL